ncbi:hypothetical protein BH11ARM1_BH11ARM1_05040 [soil metagenome]
MSEDSVEEMLALAERLRQTNGGELDESAIQAVSEATGVSIEYVRLAVMLRAEKERKSLVSTARAQYLQLGPDTRRYVFSGLAAVIAALLSVIGVRLDQFTSMVNQSEYGVFSMVSLVFVVLGVYNLSLAREARTATIAGAIFGGAYYFISAFSSMVMQVKGSYDPYMLLPFTVIGAFVGVGCYRLLERNRKKLGLRDPVKDRQDLLRQLVELQDKLHSGKQSMTFLSLDIVGSTRMKESADLLAIEFTFNEYHEFVDRIAQRYQGRVHSTAGDGIICAFTRPADAFNAAKNIQAALIELNTFRNKIGIPIVLRAGVHSGTVTMPDGDVTSVNFAHVIDMAAHIQKDCPAGGIAVSREAAAGIEGGLNSVGAGRIKVMETEAAIWAPKSRVALPAPVAEIA